MVVCKADQIRNPKSGRCVSRTGKIGKKILTRSRSRSKELPPPLPPISSGRRARLERELQVLRGAHQAPRVSGSRPVSPRRVLSKRVRKSPKKKKIVPCKSNQIRNPKSGRCVSRTGKIGKEILARSRSKTRSRTVSPKRVRSRSKTRSRPVSPKRVRSFILPIPRTAKVRTHISKADRNAMNAMGQMLFLSALHPNDCIPIATRNPKNYFDIGYIWRNTVFAQTTFVTNPGVRDHFESCLKDEKKRFILIFLHLQYWVNNKPISYHANFLIYDKNRNEIERFEPHGSHTPNIFSPERLDTHLAKYFKDRYGITYIKPLDFCPLVGPQKIQEFEAGLEKIKGERRGFCQYWSFWYANIRLENPNLERQDVIRRALLEMKKFPDEFTGYIVNYASFFADVAPFLQDPKKLKELVKKFTTD